MRPKHLTTVGQMSGTSVESALPMALGSKQFKLKNQEIDPKK